MNQVDSSGGLSRRALFPAEEETDSDLGHMSPLSYDSNSDPENFAHIGDYDIIGMLEQDHCEQTPKTKTELDPVEKIKKMAEITGLSPSQTLKTPQETASSTKHPKLIRKSLLEDDRKHADTPKVSKVRTTLFPVENLAVSVKSFYPKTEDKPIIRPFLKEAVLPRVTKNRTRKNRCVKVSKNFGHKIRKKTKRKLRKDTIKKVLNMIDNDVINEYLNEARQLALDRPKLIENKENLNTSQINIKKRSRSPNQDVEPTRKFFKTSHHKAIVSINENIKLSVEGKKINLLGSNQIGNDFNENLEPMLAETTVNNVLNLLDSNPIPDTKVESLRSSDLNVLLSPISQMSNMTSGLKLNSPKRARNLSNALEGVGSGSARDKAEKLRAEKKMFPIFSPGYKSCIESKNKVQTRSGKKFKGLDPNQMLLDAGQKRFGATQCPECLVIYHMGDPNEELRHENFHNASHVLKFNGWKNERVVAEFNEARIIRVTQTDPKTWWKRIKELMIVVNRHLGLFDVNFDVDNSEAFLYVKKKHIAGCLLAVPKDKAYKMLASEPGKPERCSEESFAVKCGISRIWVAESERRQGVASKLVDSLKVAFNGGVLKNSDIAISAPSELGKKFAERYFATQNFLVYEV